MRDVRSALPIGLAVLVLAAGGCGGDRNDGGSLPKLDGTVGSTDDPDAYEISLRTEDGVEVTTVLLPGEYTLEIDDRSSIHNFHLRARQTGVEVATDVAGTGGRNAIVAFRDGEAYIYACDAHPGRMHVTFSIHGRIRTQN